MDIGIKKGSPGGSVVKNLPANGRDAGSITGSGRFEKEMATHSSILAWKNPMDRGAWWGTVNGFKELDMAEQLNNHNKGLKKKSTF